MTLRRWESRKLMTQAYGWGADKASREKIPLKLVAYQLAVERVARAEALRET